MKKKPIEEFRRDRHNILRVFGKKFEEYIDDERIININCEEKTVSIQLRDEVTNEDLEKVNYVVIRKPTYGEMRALDDGKGEVARSMSLTVKMSNLPKRVVEDLDGSDGLFIQAVIASFLT